jgi:hypothetical protein
MAIKVDHCFLIKAENYDENVYKPLVICVFHQINHGFS